MGQIMNFIGRLSEKANTRKKLRLAEACKTGHAAAMYKMAYVMRSHCKPEEIELLDLYETEPSQEHAEKLCMRKNLSLMARAYMMWLVRAAVYRYPAAAELLEKCPVYKHLAYIPYDMITQKNNQSITFWNSTTLYEIGFIDVPKECTDCRLYYDPDKRFYDLHYVSDYEPPDEDGFGAEWEYDDIYFDEFFRRLPQKPQF